MKAVPEDVTQFSRDELFQTVWANPAPQVAARLGIDERMLRSICSRHDIPCPSDAYWARVAAGETFPRPTLRQAKDPKLEQVTITTTLPRQLAPQPKSSPRAVNEQVSPTAKSIESPVEASPALIGSLHRSVAPTARSLRKAKADANGCMSACGAGLLGIVVHEGQVERVILVLNNLATALEGEGLDLQPDDTRMKITVGQDTITFTLTEKSKRQKHIPTASEQDAYEKLQAQKQRAADRKNWDLFLSPAYNKPWPEFDKIYLGQLSLAVDVWSRGLRKTWSDGKTQRIDTKIPEIVAGLQALLDSCKAEREKREEDRRRWAELSRRRDLAHKRKMREEARIAHLRELVELQRDAADIRTWLAAVASVSEASSTTELERMLHWARERLASLEEQTTINAAMARFQGKALFPEEDELHDPLGVVDIPGLGRIIRKKFKLRFGFCRTGQYSLHAADPSRHPL